MRTTLFSIVWACCFLSLADRSWAQEALPSPSSESIGQADDASSDSSPPTESYSVGHLVEVAREVNLGLRLDEAKPAKKVQFKLSDGHVLAEMPKEDKDRLWFEVTITSPVGDVSVDFPVPDDSEIAKAYREFGKEKPNEVLVLMDGLEARVQVVALSKPIRIEKYGKGAFVSARVCVHWQPFYEISLPDAGIIDPHLVRVPLADGELYQLTRRVINVEPGPPDERVILTLAGAEQFAELDGRPPASAGPNGADGPGFGQQGDQDAGASASAL